MKQFSQQLHKKATTTVKLQVAERRELRDRLVSYMEYHPLPAEMRTAKKNKETNTANPFAETFTTVSFPLATFFRTSAVFAVILLAIVPYMAEKAVPGDTLYAVKVQFNEQLRSTLTFDSYQKVEWETERLNRRIAEARLLASEGRLTDDVEAEVAEAVRVHTANAKREIEELRTQDEDAATIATIALDTTLEVQSTSLKNEDGEDAAVMAVKETKPNLIASAIDESLAHAVSVSSTTPPAFEKLMARVEQNTTRIYELVAALEPVAAPEEMAEVSRRVEDINRAITEATDLLETDELAARKGLVEVLQRTQRLIVYMTELEVVQNVDIETLIPVVLTAEEKQAFVESQTTMLQEKLAQIDLTLETVEDESVLEKASSTRLDLDELAALMASSTDNFDAFKIHATDAQALADDLIASFAVTNETDKPEFSVSDVATSSATSTVDTASTSEEVIKDQASTTASTTEEVLEEAATSSEGGTQ